MKPNTLFGTAEGSATTALYRVLCECLRSLSQDDAWQGGAQSRRVNHGLSFHLLASGSLIPSLATSSSRFRRGVAGYV